jgi:hypothetical protein
MSLLLAAVIGGGPRVLINDTSITDIRSGVSATATYTLTNTGLVQTFTSGFGTATFQNWINPTGAAGAAYEAYVTNSGDALTSGTEATWLPLNTTRAWSVTKSGPTGAVFPVLFVQIRRASDLVVLSTANISMAAEKA